MLEPNLTPYPQNKYISTKVNLSSDMIKDLEDLVDDS